MRRPSYRLPLLPCPPPCPRRGHRCLPYWPGTPGCREGLREPRLHDPFEPGDQTGEPLRAHHEGAQHLFTLVGCSRPLRQGLGHAEDHGHGGPELVPQWLTSSCTPSGTFQERFLRELELSGAVTLALEGLRELSDHSLCDLGEIMPPPAAAA